MSPAGLHPQGSDTEKTPSLNSRRQRALRRPDTGSIEGLRLFSTCPRPSCSRAIRNKREWRGQH